MAVDAAVDHEPRGHDRGVAPRLGEQLRMQRDFERSRHLEQIDLRARDMARLDLVRGRRCGIPRPLRGARLTARRRSAAALRNADGLAPADAREYRAASWLRQVFGLGIGLQALATSDSWLSSFRTRIRAYGTTSATRKRARPPQPFSFIRTLTVGFGITPNLLTLSSSDRRRRSRAWARHPYRRWGFSPRPENIGRPQWAAYAEYAQTRLCEQEASPWENRMSP